MANKTFFTYDEQIEKLEKEKQLVISDPDFAKTTLQKLGYFSLIGGYKDLFKHKPSGNYLHGVTFEEITAFYYFDEELRTLFLTYILHVERQLKSIYREYLEAPAWIRSLTGLWPTAFSPALARQNGTPVPSTRFSEMRSTWVTHSCKRPTPQTF